VLVRYVQLCKIIGNKFAAKKDFLNTFFRKSYVDGKSLTSWAILDLRPGRRGVEDIVKAFAE
jgi:hypothetical protein